VASSLYGEKIAAIMLKKMGHSVVVANNGREAIKAFEEEGFDLILMAGHMPLMDGLEATSAIRDTEDNSKMQKTPIIAVTANAMKGDRERFLAAGMDDYISKPIKRKSLEEVIERVMAENENIA